jgi:hypothetical protein
MFFQERLALLVWAFYDSYDRKYSFAEIEVVGFANLGYHLVVKHYFHWLVIRSIAWKECQGRPTPTIAFTVARWHCREDSDGATARRDINTDLLLCTRRRAHRIETTLSNTLFFVTLKSIATTSYPLGIFSTLFFTTSQSPELISQTLSYR